MVTDLLAARSMIVSQGGAAARINGRQWTLQSGASAERIPRGCVASSEFVRAYGTQDHGAFVVGLYRNVLHPRPRPAAGPSER